ncbi:hypothetical protein HRW11_00525 [Streptomyces lunaelactis]|uniref:hypothetical protein n=1 Tax=Streptomyces lunaelactis TaxID=1535768 RepID=UPI0015858A77|nr:hypothetical protein [Streptomyces lunaelactis]NUK62629.1 hypothetical protein [Streptomyces lunaelactis]
MALFLQAARAETVAPERSGYFQTNLGLARFGQAVVECGAEIGPFLVQAGEPGRLLAGEPLGLGTQYERSVVVAMAAAQRSVFPVAQPQVAVLAEGFQHAVPRVLLLADQHGLVHQACHDAEHFLRGEAGAGADRLDRLQVEGAGEDGQSGPEQLLPGRAQIEAPVERCAHGLLARQGGSATPGQQLEPVAQPFQDLLAGQHPKAGSGQFDSQRNAIQATADQGSRPAVL